MGRHRSDYEDDDRSDYSSDRRSYDSGSNTSVDVDTRRSKKSAPVAPVAPVVDPEKQKADQETAAGAKKKKIMLMGVVGVVIIIIVVIAVSVSGGSAEKVPTDQKAPSMHTDGACVTPNKNQKQLDKYYMYEGYIGHFCIPTDELTLGLVPEIPRNDMGRPEFEIPAEFAKSVAAIQKFADHSFGCRSVVIYRPRLAYHDALQVCKHNGYQLLVLDSLMEACHLATDVQYIGTSPQIDTRPTAIWLDSQISRKEPNGTIVWTTSKKRPLGGPLKPCPSLQNSLREKDRYADLIGSDPHLFLDYRDEDITHVDFGCVNIAYKRDYVKASFVCKRCGYRNCDGMCGIAYPSYPEQCNSPHLTFSQTYQ